MFPFKNNGLSDKNMQYHPAYSLNLPEVLKMKKVRTMFHRRQKAIYEIFEINGANDWHFYCEMIKIVGMH